MKRELNAAKIFLFKEMARQFNSSVTKCSYVEEIHGKIYVDYISKYALYNPKSVELGDLWIFGYSYQRISMGITEGEAGCYVK